MVDSKHPELAVVAELLMAEMAVEALVVVEDLVVLVVLVVHEDLVTDDRMLTDHSLMVELVAVALDVIHEFSSLYLAPILMEEVEATTTLMTLTLFLVAVVVHAVMFV